MNDENTYATAGVEWNTSTMVIGDRAWYVRKLIGAMGGCHYEVALEMAIKGRVAKVWWPCATTWNHGLRWEDLIPKAVDEAVTWIGDGGSVTSIFRDAKPWKETA